MDKIKVGTLEEWVLEKEGRQRLSVRKVRFYDDEYWEISYNRGHYGKIWHKLPPHFTEGKIRCQIDEYNGTKA